MSKSAFDAEFSAGPLGDELDLVDLESVKKLIQLLTNALKSLLIYPKNNPLPKEFKENSIKA